MPGTQIPMENRWVSAYRVRDAPFAGKSNCPGISRRTVEYFDQFQLHDKRNSQTVLHFGTRSRQATMTPKQFDKIGNELFGAVLGPLGFSNERSQFCTFHRKMSDEIYHIVLAGLGTRGAWYDVKVFPVSPMLAPSFDTQFPDSLGIPSDSWSYLNDRGVGPDQQQFNCKSEENLRQRFESAVKPLLLTKAIPHLDRVRTVQDMLPLIKHPSFFLAMYHAGRTNEAKLLLQKERDRLSKLEQDDKVVSVLLSRVSQLLHDS